MLKIRGFVEGKDEEVWVRIQNEAYREYDDFRPDTLEDMDVWKKSPNFDPTGMFIAELDGKPVGAVNAFVDKRRKEKKGFLRGLGVVPEFRKRGVGRRLVERAIESLKERGMKSVEGWAREDKTACKSLLEGMGFKLIRVFSTMRRDLKRIPYGIGEHKKIEVREMETNMEDIKLLTQLENEAFKEHFNFRPRTVEEMEYWITNKPWCDILGFFFSYLDGKPVGYVGAGIDSKFIEHQGIKRGWIMDIGVLKPHRRRGIGTALMQKGMKFLKSKGMTEVDLGVDDTNPTKAIELYKKVGFRVVHKDLTYLRKID
ncbi:MAG: GNAT family N-acetyltransferase [Candidatus Bathyarchaeia archaeon]